MTTSVDIRFLVAVACILLFFSACLAAFLRGAWTDRFRHAANLFAASLAALGTAAIGVFLSQNVHLVISAVLIITGAHFSIVFAYLSIHESLRPHPALRSVLGGAGLLCLGQVCLAAVFQNAALLIFTTSAVNTVVGLLAAGSLWSLAATASPRNRLLVSAPFFLIGCAYGGRLALLATSDQTQWFVLASTVIAFSLSSASLYLGFALIIMRESALSDDLRQARAKSDEILRQRTRFFSQMNHELRTPLNGIVGLTRVLASHVNGETGARTLRDLRSSAALLQTVVDDVLDFAKLDSGAVELEAIAFNLPDVIDGVAAQYRRLAGEKSVAVRIETAIGFDPWRKGDPTRLRQILHNILANAVKFTAQGEIVLTLGAVENGAVLMTLADTGIGMSEDQLRNLFEPFRQATAGTTRKFGGTGLGMSIVKMLVSAMGGSITVHSKPGAGTSIAITLPLETTAAPAATPEKPAERPALVPVAMASGGLRLLCADDDDINRMVLEAFLREIGIAPVMVGSGSAAIARARNARFDAYLIDINMPDMGGVATLHALRQIDATRPEATPLAVAVTANVMDEDIRSYLSAGFDVHLPKPIVFDDLATLIDHLHEARTQPTPRRSAAG